MTGGIIVTVPPSVELPPGNTTGGSAILPGVTYAYAVLSLPQTWTAKQTFPLGNISVQYGDVVGLAPSATVDTTNASNITSGTLPAAQLPLPTSSTLGGVKSLTSVATKWIKSIGTDGTPTQTQPAFTDISGSVAATQLPNPTSSTLGGIQSAATVSHQWINSISTAGVPALSQPAFSDISGNISTSQMASGTGASSSTFWRGDGTWTAISGAVTSIAGNTGAFTLGAGLSNSVNSLINTGAVTVKQQSFSASGTYTPSTGMIFAIVECVGGGGGGGGASGTAGQVYGGAGGWSGAYSRALVTAATVGASKAVTIGAGGGGGAGAAVGTTGGATSVGALCVANGGTGGQFGSSAQFPTPLTGPATGTGNMIAVGGNPGIHGFYSTIITVQGYSGAGGSSIYGGGGAAVTASSAGSTGTSASGVGSGGSGALVHNTAGGSSGGSGSNGYVLITEFNSQ